MGQMQAYGGNFTWEFQRPPETFPTPFQRCGEIVSPGTGKEHINRLLTQGGRVLGRLPRLRPRRQREDLAPGDRRSGGEK